MPNKRASHEPAVLCRYQQNAGTILAPPLRTEHSLGALVPHRVTVEGQSWRESSTDIAIAGVGWLGIGGRGSASFDVWTHEGEHFPVSLQSVSPSMIRSQVQGCSHTCSLVFTLRGSCNSMSLCCES